MTRLGNKKSRKGCMRCKSRRVKCDEARPACGWCASHFFECRYPIRTGHNLTQVSQSPSSQAVSENYSGRSSSIQVTTASPPGIDSFRLELGLFQYYVYTVARSFPMVDKEQGLELHADAIPQASLGCPNLLNVMYSYALLHMHIQSMSYGILPRNADFFDDVGICMSTPQGSRDEGRTTLLTLHRDYLNAALQGQRDIVAEINHKNADGICIAAVLLALVALVHSSQMRFDETYCIPSDWFRLQASFSTCLSASRRLLRMDSATSMMVYAFPSIDNRNLHRQVPGTFRNILEWQPEDSRECMDQSTKETYCQCIVYIETIYKRIAEKEPWQLLGRRILAFPSVGASAFLALLEDHHPRALVILAHLLAMTKKLESTWWIFKDVAEYHVRGIAAMVPEKWHWALEWPMKVLNTGAADECFLNATTSSSVGETVSLL